MKPLILLLIAMLSLLVAACAPLEPVSETAPAQRAIEEAPESTGRAVFIIADAAADMSSVSSLKITVDNVQVHSAEEGWVTVSSAAKTYDLLQLKAEESQALLADIQLKPGTYQQVRLEVSSVIVTDAEGEHPAKLPSGELKIVGELVVSADQTSTATFDFQVNESLHITGKGEYILAPVIKLETTEEAEVEINAEDKVTIKKGKVRTQTEVGMDSEGNVGVGLRIKTDLNLTIEGGKIKIGELVSDAAKAKIPLVKKGGGY